MGNDMIKAAHKSGEKEYAATFERASAPLPFHIHTPNRLKESICGGACRGYDIQNLGQKALSYGGKGLFKPVLVSQLFHCGFTMFHKFQS
jgi:hypothetical protein